MAQGLSRPSLMKWPIPMQRLGRAAPRSAPCMGVGLAAPGMGELSLDGELAAVRSTSSSLARGHFHAVRQNSLGTVHESLGEAGPSLHDVRHLCRTQGPIPFEPQEQTGEDKFDILSLIRHMWKGLSLILHTLWTCGANTFEDFLLLPP